MRPREGRHRLAIREELGPQVLPTAKEPSFRNRTGNQVVFRALADLDRPRTRSGLHLVNVLPPDGTRCVGRSPPIDGVDGEGARLLILRRAPKRADRVPSGKRPLMAPLPPGKISRKDVGVFPLSSLDLL